MAGATHNAHAVKASNILEIRFMCFSTLSDFVTEFYQCNQAIYALRNTI